MASSIVVNNRFFDRLNTANLWMGDGWTVPPKDEWMGGWVEASPDGDAMLRQAQQQGGWERLSSIQNPLKPKA